MFRFCKIAMGMVAVILWLPDFLDAAAELSPTLSYKALLVSAAKSLGIDEERMFRAVMLSHLMAIHTHADFGLLSGFCGATIAGTATAGGLVYLQGGTLEQVGFAVNNMFGDVSGMLCNGAKADCALKVCTCVLTAFQCAAMALRGECVKSTNGIVETDPEDTIRNFVRLAMRALRRRTA